MDVESFDERSGASGQLEPVPDQPAAPRRPGGAIGWLKRTNHSASAIDLIKRARRALPGDPDFGDPLSAAGLGGPAAAARAADRLLQHGALSRELSLTGLQLWQALTERVSGRPANPEMTLVFTDLVGFSSWALGAGDDATLQLLRRVAQAIEPPILEAGGQIVKRMGDGAMAVFPEPATAIRAVLAGMDALTRVEVDGYVPRMRAGIHTGHPQRLGSDWLGVDVNIAARVMDRATKGGVVVSQTTLDRISTEEFEALGVTAKRLRRHVLTAKTSGLPVDLAMYRLRLPKEPPVEETEEV